jgi:hypothetical protein
VAQRFHVNPTGCANAFTKATITVVAFPQKDGDPLSVRVQLEFSDAKQLDETFTAVVGAAFSGCGGA